MVSKYIRTLTSGLPKAALGLAGLLAVAANAQTTTAGSTLDDFEAGTAQNKFLGYTFFYTDAADGGQSTVSSGTTTGTGTTTKVAFDPVKSIDATGGANGSTKSLKLDFTYGTVKPKSCAGTCEYGQMVGVGTQFVPGSDAGAVLDMTGGTSISFWAKAAAPTIVRVEVATSTVTDFGFHRAQFNITTTWTQFTFTLTEGLGGLARPAWATTAIPFDITKCQKLQFQVSAEDNTTMTAGTLWLDDIKVAGYNWVPPAACMSCVGAVGAGTGGLLSDLEPAATVGAKGGTQNLAGGYWYCYNDIGTRTVAAQSEYSEIFAGISTVTPDPKTPILVASPGKGANASAGAFIQFTLGPTYSETGSTDVIQPFVGIGTKVSNTLGTTFFDGSLSTGISFDYNTDVASTFKFIRLECKANQVLSATNAGVVHYVLLPATNGVWKSATVPWSKLVLPDWVDSPPLATNPLKISALEKFQWAVQDAPKTTGTIAVDNVKLIGMGLINGIKDRGTKAANPGLRLSQIAGKVLVDYVSPRSVDRSELTVTNISGVVVASQPITEKGSIHASLDTQAFHNGLYTLQIRNSQGVVSMPFTVLH